MADLTLNSHEARVLGVLVEKEMTTPDQYPLSLNAATGGSNQKSNRSPVVDYLEAEVDVALQGLVMKGLAGRVVPAGSRVEKFRHNARERLKLGDVSLAVLAELLLRGAQQPGELRARASRMQPIASLPALTEALAPLLEAGLVRRLAPAPGTRAERYQQLLAPEELADATPASPASPPSPAAPAPAATAAPASPPGPAGGDPVEALAAEVARLRAGLEHLAESLGVELPG